MTTAKKTNDGLLKAGAAIDAIHTEAAMLGLALIDGGGKHKNTRVLKAEIKAHKAKLNETKKAEILAEMEATKAKATAPLNPEKGETNKIGNNADNPKFVKASIAARKKALADMAALKQTAKELAAEPDELTPQEKELEKEMVKATKKASKAPKDTVPEPVVKKLLPKGTNAKRKLIVAAMSEFPSTFSMVDYEGHKLTLSRDDSDADLKTEKVMLAICDAQGNVIAKHSPKMLHAIVIGGKKGKAPKAPKVSTARTGKKDARDICKCGATRGEHVEGFSCTEWKLAKFYKPAKRTSKPHVKGERKTESNIPLMMRLLREGKTQEQIFTEFRSRYTEQNVEHKDESWTWDRVVIYHKIAFGKLPKDERKAVITTEINKPKKGKVKAGKKPATETTETTEKPTKGKKKDKTKTPAEPKVDGVSKAERKAKQKAKAEATDAAFATLLAKAEGALEEAKKTKADGAVIVRLARELKELKESNEPCVACSGRGMSSKRNVCEPCKGTGKKGMAN